MPRTETTALGGFLFISVDFCDFRTNGPRTSIRIDDLSAPSGTFVARVSASVATADRCPDRGRILPAAYTAFSSVFAVATEVAFSSIFAVATEVGTGSVEGPAAATTVAQPPPFSRISTCLLYTSDAADE